MFRTLSSYVLALALCGATGCGSDPKCPPGNKRVGSQCRADDSDPSKESDAAVTPNGGDSDGGSDGPGSTCSDDELCNDLDDDCDGDVDEGVLVPVYADQDGDGLGAGAVVSDAGCVGAGLSATSDDCDDTNATIGAGLAELCDGLDNDCDGQPDQSFACALGQLEVACTTSCGSMGVGSCSDQCAAPAPAECTPPVETCNFKDDNCDGVADEGLLARLAPDGIWTDAAAAGKYNNLVSMAPRAGGGAWFFYMPSASPLFDAREVASISVAQLTREGTLDKAIPSGKAKMTDATSFVADGNELITAVVSRTYLGGNAKLRLQLFNASTLAFISEKSVETTTPRTTSLGAGTDIIPVDIAVHTASGHTYVAVAYLHSTTTQGNSVAALESRVAVAHMSPTGIWDNFAPSKTVATSGLLHNNMQIEAVPCRDEFMLVYASTDVSGVRHVALDANLTTADPVANATGVTALAHRPSKCDEDSASPELLLVYMETGDKTRFRRVRVDAAGNYVNAGDISSGTGIISGDATFTGGRWLTSGYEYLGGDQATVAPWLWEVGFDGDGDERVKDLPAISAISGAVLPGQMFGSRSILLRTAILDTGAAIVAAFPNAPWEGSGSQLDGARPPGVTAPAVAATYRLGCP